MLYLFYQVQHGRTLTLTPTLTLTLTRAAPLLPGGARAGARRLREREGGGGTPTPNPTPNRTKRREYGARHQAQLSPLALYTLQFHSLSQHAGRMHICFDSLCKRTVLADPSRGKVAVLITVAHTSHRLITDRDTTGDSNTDTRLDRGAVRNMTRESESRESGPTPTEVSQACAVATRAYHELSGSDSPSQLA